MKHFTPLIFVMVLAGACTKSNDPSVVASPVLKSVTYHIQSSSGDYRPAEKIDYFYAGGKLVREEQSQYDTQQKVFLPFSVAQYSYFQNNLVAIEKTLVDYPKKIVTGYSYSGNILTRIVVDDDIDTSADIQYLSDETIEITYSQSNGRWFKYRFTTTGNNIPKEQTIGDDNQLSSQASHEYDQKNNPLRLLGYMDLFFTNFSVNNKISTSSQYFGSYPTSTPVSYQYVYNDKGYPTEQITTYRSTGASQTTSTSKTVFEYQ